MKKYNVISSILLILLFIGCEINPENTIISKDNLAYDQDTFIENINTDLNLNRSQEKNLKSRLGDSKDFQPYSNSIWKLAATLYDILSKEQINNLLSPSKTIEKNDDLNTNGSKNSKKDSWLDFKINYFYEIADDNQKIELDALKVKFLQFQDSLKLQFTYENANPTKDEFKFNMFALNNYFKISIDNILTDEQMASLESEYDESKKSEKDFEKTEYFEEEKLSLLEITEEQISQLDQLDLKFKNDLILLNNEFIENVLSDYIYIKNTVSLLQNYQISKSQALTDKQNSIINIHNALMIRFHEKYKYSTKG